MLPDHVGKSEKSGSFWKGKPTGTRAGGAIESLRKQKAVLNSSSWKRGRPFESERKEALFVFLLAVLLVFLSWRKQILQADEFRLEDSRRQEEEDFVR